jgi:hypothetical protein
MLWGMLAQCHYFTFGERIDLSPEARAEAKRAVEAGETP